jgi:hypothetical protein
LPTMSFFTGSYRPMRRPPNMHCRCRPGGGGGARVVQRGA